MERTPERHEVVVIGAGQCGCGVTFFGETSQLTLRGSRSTGQAWATRFAKGAEEVVCVEQYDAHGRFCAAIGLRPEALAWQQALWRERLLQAEQC